MRQGQTRQTCYTFKAEFLLPLNRGHVNVPSLLRIIIFCAVVVGLIYGAMFALARMYEPEQREMRVKVPSRRINQNN